MNVSQGVSVGFGFLVSTLLAVACTATPGRITQKEPVSLIDAQGGAGLEGYDAVAYFTEHAPVRGSDAYAYEWRGATWKFVSAAHRDAFAVNPARYAPQYGGYCAYAVSHGATAHGDPNQWAIVRGRLFVNNNPFAKSLWDRDRPGNILAGDQNWPLIPKRDGSSSEPTESVRRER